MDGQVGHVDENPIDSSSVAASDAATEIGCWPMAPQPVHTRCTWGSSSTEW